MTQFIIVMKLVENVKKKEIKNHINVQIVYIMTLKENT